MCSPGYPTSLELLNTKTEELDRLKLYLKIIKKS